MGVQFHALLLGPRISIEDSRLEPYTLLKGTAKDQKLKSFHLRPPHDDNAGSFQAELEGLLQIPGLRDIKFGLMNAFENPDHPPTPGSPFGSYGLTSLKHWMIGNDVDGQEIHVWIAFQLLAPLFRNDLTDGELLGQQMMVAITFVHEMIHAINHAKVFKDIQQLGKVPNNLDYTEPFFEDEPLKECGFSAENAVSVCASC